MIVPRHSELSAARHDEAAVTVGTGGGGPPGGGVAAARIGRRRHPGQGRLQKQRCGGGICVSMHLPAPTSSYCQNTQITASNLLWTPGHPPQASNPGSPSYQLCYLGCVSSPSQPQSPDL